MTVDIHQLPIPNWNLACPVCGYSLNGLPSHRCPECGAAFKIDEIVATWTRLRAPTYSGNELPFPDFGLQCAACAHPLAGAARFECPACTRAFDPGTFRPRHDWFQPSRESGSRRADLMRFALQQAQIPYLTFDSPSIYSELSRTALAVPSEFYFDYLHALQLCQFADQPDDLHLERETSWTCPRCSEHNPPAFSMCWNCSSDHP